LTTLSSSGPDLSVHVGFADSSSSEGHVRHDRVTVIRAKKFETTERRHEAVVPRRCAGNAAEPGHHRRRHGLTLALALAVFAILSSLAHGSLEAWDRIERSVRN